MIILFCGECGTDSLPSQGKPHLKAFDLYFTFLVNKKIAEYSQKIA